MELKSSFLSKIHRSSQCISLLLSYASTNFHKLKQVHAFSIRHGVPLDSPDMGKHLIFTLVSLATAEPRGMPAMAYAHEIFNQIQYPNIFTWNTMIRGYAESENPNPVVEIHRQMVANSVEADTHTYPFLLKAIAKLLAVREGEKVHCISMKNGFELLVLVQNALVHFYGACGQAEKLFEFMSDTNLVALNSVINGYALNSRPNESLTLYRKMEWEDVKPDGFTMVSLLTACAELGALALGRRVHVCMLKLGLDKNMNAANIVRDQSRFHHFRDGICSCGDYW